MAAAAQLQQGLLRSSRVVAGTSNVIASSIDTNSNITIDTIDNSMNSTHGTIDCSTNIGDIISSSSRSTTNGVNISWGGDTYRVGGSPTSRVGGTYK